MEQASRCPDASVTATLVRTGQTLVPTTLDAHGARHLCPGRRRQHHLIRRAGDAVQARISKGAQSMTADYVFSVPDGCHVNKVSGPTR